ncbi:hypothetical protein ACFYWU_26410 [Streptomyces chrestomyceticus]
MLPGQIHRMKGAVMLGARHPGEPGPFGTWPRDEDPRDDAAQEEPDDEK